MSDPVEISSSLDSSVSDERPQRLGSGSFASVYMIRGGNIAFKEVHRPNEDEAVLQKEYETLGGLYVICNTDTFFMLPRPYAFCQPKNPANFRGNIPLTFAICSYSMLSLLLSRSSDFQRRKGLLQRLQGAKRRIFPLRPSQSTGLKSARSSQTFTLKRLQARPTTTSLAYHTGPPGRCLVALRPSAFPRRPALLVSTRSQACGTR